MTQPQSAPAIKVPEPTFLFWVTTALVAALGESASDYLFNTLGRGVVTILVDVVVFAVAMVLQLRSRRYSPIRYWFALTATSLFATMLADVVDVGVGVPSLVTTIIFAIVLAAIFLAWGLTQHSLSIRSVTTRRRQLFYWGAVLAAFTMGTAAIDYLARTLALGYLLPGIVFLVLTGLVTLAWRLGLNAVFSFWFAFITTRLFAAALVDWVSLSDQDGRGWGSGPVSLVLVVVVVVLAVTMQTRARAAQLSHRSIET